jgi:hypothetical protein
MRSNLNFRAVTTAITSSRYAELEKRIQRETDPARKKSLERDLLRAMRTGRRP